MSDTIPTLINQRWTLNLPEQRAQRPGWGHWEQDVLAWLWGLIRPGDVVWDVGAEEGDLSALYASWGAKLVLVEPSPPFWPLIRQTFVANGLEDSVVGCFPGFAADFTAVNPDRINYDASIADDGWPVISRGVGISEFGFRHTNEQTDETATVRLDDLHADGMPAPDLITMDIEGAEYRAILGAERLLAEVKPIVFVSVHPEFMRDRYGDTPDDLLTHMEIHGYEGFRIAFDHEFHHLFKPRVGWHG